MADIAKFVEEIKGLTVMELADLVKAIEEEFGVSAAAPVMVAGPVFPVLPVLPLLRRSPSLMLFWLRLALPRWASSSWSKRSPAWA